MEADDKTESDLLYGMPEIARFLGLKEPAARHLADNGTLPTFTIGRRVCGRRSTLSAWLADQEAKGRANG